MLTGRFLLLIANVGRTSRSLSTNDNCPTHSIAHSPSIGSFQVFSRQLELPTDPRLKVLTQTNKRGQVDVQDDGMDVGGQISPKKDHGNDNTSPEGQGLEAAVGKASSHERGNSQRSRGESNDTGVAKGSRSPKHRRAGVTEVGVDKHSPKRRRGVQKNVHVEEIHDTPRDSRIIDEFEDGSEEDGSGSDSARAEGGEEGEDHGEIDAGEGEERSPTATKKCGKKSRLARGGNLQEAACRTSECVEGDESCQGSHTKVGVECTMLFNFCIY